MATLVPHAVVMQGAWTRRIGGVARAAREADCAGWWVRGQPASRQEPGRRPSSLSLSCRPRRESPSR
jgi:hypothetical protein